MRYADLWPIYAKYWDRMEIKPSRVAQFNEEAEFAIDHKEIYQQISDGSQSKVPWEMIACLHRRESDANFNTYLGNGQALSHVTTIVPKGRGPFTGPNAFVDGGLDAIRQEGWGSVVDWRLEKMLYYMLLFNGVGTEPHIPSSYIWGGTNIQKPGKWIEDHVYNPYVWDPQPGCAPLILTIINLDPSVPITRETA